MKTTEQLCKQYNGVILENYPNYIITPVGEIYSITRKKFIDKTLRKRNPTDINSKYDEIVHIHNTKNTVSIAVHRLLAMAFIPNPDNMTTVNHIDGNPSNNRLDNLEWLSQSDNSKHAHDLGLVSGKYTECSMSTLCYKEIPVATFKSVTMAAKWLEEHGITPYVPVIANAAVKNEQVLPNNNTVPYTAAGYVWRYTDTKEVAPITVQTREYTLDISEVTSVPWPDNPRYLVTVDGRVYDIMKQEFLKVSTVIPSREGSNPYATVFLHKDAGSSKKSTVRLARLVASCFMECNGRVVHKDGNVLNCAINNLEVVSYSGTEKSITAYTLSWKDDTVTYYSSTRELAESTGISLSSVQEAINLNKNISIQHEFSTTNRPRITNNIYVIRGLSKN